MNQARTDAGAGPPGAFTTDEREELQRLRRETRQSDWGSVVGTSTLATSWVWLVCWTMMPGLIDVGDTSGLPDAEIIGTLILGGNGSFLARSRWAAKCGLPGS